MFGKFLRRTNKKEENEWHMVTIKMIHIPLEIWGSIFCIIAAVCIFISRNFESRQRKIVISMQLSTALLLIMDALCWGFRGYPGVVGYYTVRIFNFAVFFMNDMIMILYHAYVCSFIFGKEKKEQSKRKPVRVYLVYLIVILGMLLLIVSQFANLYYYFDADNFYHRKPMYPLSIFLVLLGEGLDLSLLIQYRRRVKKAILISLISYVVLPVIAAFILFFYYGLSLINIAITISMIFMFIVAIIEQKKVLEQKEKEMSDLRIEVMLSQISPHFIYNTLTAIQYLCIKDPLMAEETVGEFAVYLRNTIDSLTTKKNIPFEKELEHVKNYLSIEKKRFGDCVKVKYDITEKDFLIPTLTLQPIVENAIKYGIGKKAEGGTISIHTKKTMEEYIIIIEDDGAGFDIENIKEDGRSHIGIPNVRSRLASMCKGSLFVESVIGQGTAVTIKLPVISSYK